MRQLVESRWFAIADLLLVLISAAAWMSLPRYGLGFSLFALLPWVIRLLAGRPPFQRTLLDWLIAVFLVTACVGYWAAYDTPSAWVKFWLIVNAVLLYYALSAQPKQNFSLVSFLSFCFAVVLSLYFFLTYDFAGRGGMLGKWWTNYAPHVDWPAIHPGYVSGLVLISGILALYWLWDVGQKFFRFPPVVVQRILFLGMGILGLVFVLTLSRGIEVISLGIVGLWTLWSVATFSGWKARVRAVFPLLVLSYLLVLIAFAFLGPASDVAGLPSDNYGTNSRAEVFARGLYFLADYPITGAGLSSFPGLYSQYMIVIPYFYFGNSYNLFLDIAIEQGWVGGAAFLFMCLAAIWLVSRRIVNEPSNELRLFNWLSLLSLLVMIVHGLFYDYLYQGNGIALMFFPLGMMVMGAVERNPSGERSVRLPRVSPRWSLASITLPVVAAVLMFGGRPDQALSRWYANWGALQMSQAELRDFPTDRWATAEMAHRLTAAEATLQAALQYDPQNRTANHRLGLISMLRQDFKTGAAQLETAYQKAPEHRGIIKNLGYCYVWLGEMDKAQFLLDRIPEAQHEMGVYIWWWRTQGRPDLSEKASQMVSRLGSASQ